MSDPLDAAGPPAETRAARMKAFRREQCVVDYLNRGVSVAEISARFGIGEKRMRAVIREILARRMPGPPEEFVAIQMSRLNEALLVAYSAMSPTNLRAVGQVVRIVRELDRYRGFCAAERRLPEASPRTTLPGPDGAAGKSKAFGQAAPNVRDDRDVSDPDVSDPDFSDPDFSDLDCPLEDARAREGAEPAPAASEPAVTARREEPRAAERAESRPGIPAQSIEKVDSAPGFSAAPDAPEPASGPLSDPEAAAGGFLKRLAIEASRSKAPPRAPGSGTR